jgi:AraC-like DNA-binding protein
LILQFIPNQLRFENQASDDRNPDTFVAGHIPNMRFDIYTPCDILAPYIRSIAISESAGQAPYKVLPDTGLVIGFQYQGKLACLNDNSEVMLSTAGITGLHDAYRNFQNISDTGTVLIFFKESGAAAFFDTPMHELFSQSISLDHFILRSELLVIEEKLQQAGTDAKRIGIVEQFLISQMKDTVPDTLVAGALALIHRSKGNIRIRDLALQLHTSPSPLEKRFRRSVGATPKKFASIVRLKHLIAQCGPRHSFTDIGYEAGFYDQAHFIKEFKDFTGETPGIFFSPK